MELMNRIRERVVAWQKKRVRTVVFPLAGKLCAVETVEGKRLGGTSERFTITITKGQNET